MDINVVIYLHKGGGGKVTINLIIYKLLNYIRVISLDYMSFTCSDKFKMIQSLR